jgi:hypothetical protein
MTWLRDAVRRLTGRVRLSPEVSKPGEETSQTLTHMPIDAARRERVDALFKAALPLEPSQRTAFSRQRVLGGRKSAHRAHVVVDIG